MIDVQFGEIGGRLIMKIIKSRTSDDLLKAEPFNFKRINDLNEFNVLTSYMKGESPEYESEMDKLFMVIDGNIQFKVDDKKTKMVPGDIILLQTGEKFQINALDGAKLLQFNKNIVPSEPGKVMGLANSRQSIRKFRDKPVQKKDIYYILKSGMHAPSGVNRQPWKFVVIGDPEMKRKIREAAEKVEKKYYQKMKKTDLMEDIKSLGLSWAKPFLERAPFLICIFGDESQPFYRESLWLAIGWMILAAQELGLATLTYKPSDMNFITRLLTVNKNYKPELLIPVGYAFEADPPQPRKDLHEVVSWI